MAHAPPITEKWVQRRVVQPGACCGFPDKEREAKARYPLIKPIATKAKQGGDVRVDGVRIDGNLQIEQNAIIAHVIDGDLQVFKNRGAVRNRGNATNGNLQCKENRGGVTGQGNRADDKEDQCARL